MAEQVNGTEILCARPTISCRGVRVRRCQPSKLMVVALGISAVWIACFSCLRDGNAMLRDDAYFLSAVLSLAIILGWLSFLTLAMQASGRF